MDGTPVSHTPHREEWTHGTSCSRTGVPQDRGSWVLRHRESPLDPGVEYPSGTVPLLKIVTKVTGPSTSGHRGDYGTTPWSPPTDQRYVGTPNVNLVSRE